MSHTPRRPPYVGTAVIYTIGAAAVYAFLLPLGAIGDEPLGGLVFASVLAVFYGTILTSWFVLPLGVALGFVFPRIVLDVPAGVALVRAAACGVAAGLFVTVCLKLMYRLSELLALATSVVPYCLVVSLLIALHFRRIADSAELRPVV